MNISPEVPFGSGKSVTGDALLGFVKNKHKV